MQSFITHNREVITGERLIKACEAVAQWQEANAYAIRREDAYASHVTEARKEEALAEYLAWADKTCKMENLHNFSVWQRVNAELTGECVAFLP